VGISIRLDPGAIARGLGTHQYGDLQAILVYAEYWLERSVLPNNRPQSRGRVFGGRRSAGESWALPSPARAENCDDVFRIRAPVAMAVDDFAEIGLLSAAI